MTTTYQTPFSVSRVGSDDPTERQLSYIASLIDSRDLSDTTLPWRNRTTKIGVALLVAAREQLTVNAVLLSSGEPELTKSGASKLIEWLQQLPKREQRTAVVEDVPAVDPEVPAGRYAVETGEGATNELAFYKVDRPTEGKWAGWTFVKLMSSDSEQRLPWATAKAVLAKIVNAGIEESSKRYGREIGACGVCGRTLTNDASRAAGIGPICAESF